MSTTTAKQYVVRQYELPLASPGTAIITMPESADVLSCEVQDGRIVIWATVEVGGKECQWSFKLYRTDQTMDASTEDVWEMSVGMVRVTGGVLHVFIVYDEGK